MKKKAPGSDHAKPRGPRPPEALPCPWPLSIGGTFEHVPEGALHLLCRTPGEPLPEDWDSGEVRLRLWALVTPERPGEEAFALRGRPGSALRPAQPGWTEENPDWQRVPRRWQLGCDPAGPRGLERRSLEQAATLVAAALGSGQAVHVQCSQGVTRSVSVAAAALATLSPAAPGSWKQILGQLRSVRPEASVPEFQLALALESLLRQLGHDPDESAAVRWN